jgi:hypothetical protein
MGRTTLNRSFVLAAFGAVAFAGAARTEEFATGVVYHDANGNAQREDGEAGIAGVRVSNGRDIVQTGPDGTYKIAIDDDCIIFVIKPRGWMTRVDELQIPRFYYIHKPAGSPEYKFQGVAPTGPLPASVDFPLQKRAEPDEFDVILFGDTQPRNAEEVAYIAHDVLEELIDAPAAFGVTLGDIVYDDLDVMQLLNEAIAHVGAPWYNVIGNHDINFQSADDLHADETFERVYGPPYYSFDYGPVHFIAIDDVYWVGPKGEEKGKYHGEIDAAQLEFLRNDLALVPAEQLVVVMMHIPLEHVDNRQALFELLGNRQHKLAIAGHMHFNLHKFFDSNDGWTGADALHQFVAGTVSGSWWSGAKDERGIPHTLMRDGAPNCYVIARFSGTQVKMHFQAAGRPARYQMNIYLPESIAADRADGLQVLANVFNGSSRSKVRLRVDKQGPWIEMEQLEIEDPAYVRTREAEMSLTPEPGRKLPEPIKSQHIWSARLPGRLTPGTHVVEVRETDMFGVEHGGWRIFRVE